MSQLGENKERDFLEPGVGGGDPLEEEGEEVGPGGRVVGEGGGGELGDGVAELLGDGFEGLVVEGGTDVGRGRSWRRGWIER